MPRKQELIKEIQPQMLPTAKKRTKRPLHRLGPAASTVRRNLRRLRKLIDESDDLHEQRIAYAMETAIRWAREETVGWGDIAREAVVQAEILKAQLRAS